jgi:hypothetical protein
MNEDTLGRRVDWRAANLRGTQLAGLNLEHADMRGADLREVNFTGSNLRYADLRGANVSGANFQQSTLYGAKLQGVEAFQTDFRNCDMRQCNFGGAYLDGAMMLQARLEPQQEAQALAEKGSAVDFGSDWHQRVADRREKTVSENKGQGEQARGQSEKDQHQGAKRRP